MDKMVAGHSAAAWKKSGIGALVGAIVGAGTVAGLMHVARTDFIDAMGGSRVALAGVAIPFVEVHISNVYKREVFRHHSYLSDLALGVVAGLGPLGYEAAVRFAAQHAPPA